MSRASGPGQLLSADTFMVGSLKGIGRVYLHAVVDTHGSYAFGFLHVSKQPEAAVAVLHNDVLPFYRQLDLPVTAVLTDNGREFCGTERHPYELYLALNDIEHRKTKVRSPQTNGFVERFNGTVLEEFFRPVMHAKLFPSVEALQADLDTWLHHYNHERPHLGYRNQGRRPWETVERFRTEQVSSLAEDMTVHLPLYPGSNLVSQIMALPCRRAMQAVVTTGSSPRSSCRPGVGASSAWR